MFYPLWLAKKHEGLKDEILERLNAIPKAILRPMYIKSFSKIGFDDIEGNPPIITD